MRYFDYESVAREAGVPETTLAEWQEGFRSEYPDDEMMVELRLLRACLAASQGPGYLAQVKQDLSEEFQTAHSAPACRREAVRPRPREKP